ncbi:MAG TPA: CehA/McbA family metallohydrolase [Mycobacterium sp.]|nr:CehA/McbA family metallohydrolase [Mycobacterium sp.]
MGLRAVRVPAGINRIDVSTSHDQFSLLGIGRNVLDLGIFGPAGHALATPRVSWLVGRCAGGLHDVGRQRDARLPCRPIEQGRWAMALGPVVINPLGMDWQANVVLTEGVQPSLRYVPTVRASAQRGWQAGWYRGDLHTHTVHSDGRRRIEEMAEAAKSTGLDFIVSTDHNTSSANRAWGSSTSTELEVIAGEEVTTRHGHWLTVGLPPDGWVDYAARVRADGGRVVAAHPSVPLPGCAWEFGYHDVDAMEVWNGLWNVDDELSLRIWHQLLRQGRRIVAVGGSDSHVSEQPVGRPQTVVYAEEPSTAGLIDGLRHGRCYVAESSGVTLAFNASRDRDTVAVTAEVRGAHDTTISLITDTGCVGRAKTDADGAGSLACTAPRGAARFARVEVRRRSRFPSMLALSNPVWLDALA